MDFEYNVETVEVFRTHTLISPEDVPKLAGEMILVRNRPVSRPCQPNQTASGLTNHVQKTTTHAQVTLESLNTSDSTECNEQHQNRQNSSLSAEGDGRCLIGSTQGKGSSDSATSNSDNKTAEPTRDSCKVGHSNRSFQDDTVNHPLTYKPSTSSAKYQPHVIISPSQELQQPQTVKGEANHLVGRGASTRQISNARVHRWLGYESSVCSTDIELTPRLVPKVNCQVIYQSSLDSSDGECDWRSFNDRFVATESVPEANANLNTVNCLPLRDSYDESSMYLHKKGVQRQEAVKDTQRFATGSYRHRLESPQLSEDCDDSVLGTDSLQRISAPWKRMRILKSQTSIDSINSYNSLRSGFLGGEEDNGDGFTDEDENKPRLEHKKKKQLKDSNKRKTSGSSVTSPPVENSLSVNEIIIMEKQNDYHDVTHEKVSTESSSIVSEITEESGSEPFASENLSTVVDMGYFTQDGTFPAVSSVETQDEDSASDSSSSKVIQTENVKTNSSESKRQDQPLVDSSSQNTTTAANKQICNQDSTPFRRRLVNAVKERTGRKIYHSMEMEDNQNGDCGYICV